MYSTEVRQKYAELLKTATEVLAPLFGIDVNPDAEINEKGEEE